MSPASVRHVSDDILTPATPSAAGVDARGIGRFLDAIEADPAIRPHGLVILRNGLRIAEGYWDPYRVETAHLIYSVSKSFTASAAALARQEGLLDLDATVLSYFPELDADITDPRSRSMTVAHVAAMSSGHTFDTIEKAHELDPSNLVRGFLMLPPEADPGTVFAYNQPCTYTLATIVQRVTGTTLIDYLRPRLLDPLGIGTADWLEHPVGRNLGFSGLHVATDAIARLGELYRRGGLWGDRRLLDEEWVALATRAHIPTPGMGVPDWEQGYGFQFWMSRHGYRGDGAFGQFCVVVPDSGLVVAFTSETEHMQEVLDAIWNHVLPAIDAPADPAEDLLLADRLASLRLEPLRTTGEEPDAGWNDRRFTVPVPATPRRTGDPGVVEVRVVGEAETGWRIDLVDARGALEIPFASGEWVRSDPNGMPVAASGGWSPAGDLEVEVLFLDTPHTLLVTCSPSSEAATVAWATLPLHGAAARDQHRHRRVVIA